MTRADKETAALARLFKRSFPHTHKAPHTRQQHDCAGKTMGTTLSERSEFEKGGIEILSVCVECGGLGALER